MAASALPMYRGITVSDFLRQRNVTEDVISCLEEEKIDKDVIPLMEDRGLAKYIPSYGDRLALINFCKNQTLLQKKKMGLFEKLRTKLQMRKTADANKTNDQVQNIESSGPAIKKGKAAHRKIEIGWLHSENGKLKQVKVKQGGGTRTIVIGVKCGMDTVLQKGKNLFFPNGMSTKGHETDFNFEVWDYKQNRVTEDVTIGLVYDTLCMTRLRFYIATFPKEQLQNDSDLDETEDNDEVEKLNDEVNQDNLQLDADDMEKEDDVGQSGDDFQEQHNLLLYEQNVEFPNIVMDGGKLDSPLLLVTDSHGIRGPQYITDHFYSVTDKMQLIIPNIDLTSDVSDQEVTFGPGDTGNTSDNNDTEPYDFNVMLQQQPPYLPYVSGEGLPQQPPSMRHVSGEGLPQQPPSTPGLPKIVTIHHGNCLNEMIKEFFDPAVLKQPLIIKRLLPDNTEENGVGSGAVRDVYCSFWQEFYDRCTVGTTVKVPFIRHDFSYETWKAIGRILVKGYQTCQYLPIKLALPLMEAILYGSVCSNLLETFMHFVSCEDHDILQRALKDFSTVDTDELLEVLDNYECRKRVAAETLKDILMEIAHKELVQKPMYVIDCWKEVMQPNITFNHNELLKMYDNLKPSPKKVLGLLQFPEMTPKQREVHNHLKRYIRELDEEKLGKFLRFTTGSDVVTSDKIEIMFTNMSEFTRRPVGHTCGRVLEMADCYDSFPDFRSEFNSVLESNVWIMDIV